MSLRIAPAARSVMPLSSCSQVSLSRETKTSAVGKYWGRNGRDSMARQPRGICGGASPENSHLGWAIVTLREASSSHCDSLRPTSRMPSWIDVKLGNLRTDSMSSMARSKWPASAEVTTMIDGGEASGIGGN